MRALENIATAGREERSIEPFEECYTARFGDLRFSGVFTYDYDSQNNNSNQHAAAMANIYQDDACAITPAFAICNTHDGTGPCNHDAWEPAENEGYPSMYVKCDDAESCPW